MRPCVECGREATLPTDGRAPIVTERGVHCDAECLADGEIARVQRMRTALGQPLLCPVCREGHTSPAYAWTCCEACADIQAERLVAGAA